MTEQQRKLVRARCALAFYETYGRRPTDQELARHIRRALDNGHGIVPGAVKGNNSASSPANVALNTKRVHGDV